MKASLFGALLAVASLGALSEPACAREGQKIAIALIVDSGAVVEIGDDGTGVAGLKGEELKAPTPWVRSVAMHFTNGRYDWAIGDKSVTMKSGDTGVPSDPVMPGQIRFAFRRIGDSDHRLLMISNGYDRTLIYRASIRVDGEDQYTDVCSIPPYMHGFEHWPYASDRILMSDFRLEDWPDGTPPRCE